MTVTIQSLQQCTRCVMDTTDPDITFDHEGVCDHCRRYDAAQQYWQREARQLPRLLASIKQNGEGQPYDCLMGISGGVDSSYLLYVMVAEFALRPFVFHVDNAWDTPIARANIQRLCTALELDLHTIPLDPDLVYDIQRAFIVSGVPDCDIASDHIIQAVYWDLARTRRISSLIYGVNYRTETHGVRAWSQGHADWTYIQGIHQRFGTRPTAIPHYSVWWLLWQRLTKQYAMIPLLNYVDYHRDHALDILQTFCGYEPYGGKHGENVFTRWFQGYYLPTRFGYDKRKSHLSNLICAGELSRDEVVQQLQQVPYDSALMSRDTAEICHRLKLSNHDFVSTVYAVPKTYDDYPHSRLLTLMVKAKQWVKGTR